MIFIWVCIVSALAIGGFVFYGLKEVVYEGKLLVIGRIITAVVTAIIVIALVWWLYGTESGKRVQKTFESETGGGLERVVTVYDMEGDVIAEYQGKFDVDETATSGITKIKFDVDGKRHIIYCTTGTVIIDEVGE